jgi:hypothetical protein
MPESGRVSGFAVVAGFDRGIAVPGDGPEKRLDSGGSVLIE